MYAAIVRKFVTYGQVDCPEVNEVNLKKIQRQQHVSRELMRGLSAKEALRLSKSELWKQINYGFIRILQEMEKIKVDEEKNGKKVLERKVLVNDILRLKRLHCAAG